MAYISMSYLDRYLSTTSVSKKTFELAATASLFLVIKLYERGSTLSLIHSTCLLPHHAAVPQRLQYAAVFAVGRDGLLEERQCVGEQTLRNKLKSTVHTARYSEPIGACGNNLVNSKTVYLSTGGK